VMRSLPLGISSTVALICGAAGGRHSTQRNA
jgi:hypothetical protein